MTLIPLSIDSERTRTLAANYYTNEDILKQEKEDLFYKSWSFACHASELAEPGSFVTTQIFEQNIFVTRGMDGKIRAFYNVCPHRGHQLVEGSGVKKRITCPYHAWTFALDGSLIGLQRKEKTIAPSRDQICLNQVSVDQIVDFVFVNLDPDAKPLAEFAPRLAEQILEEVPDIRELNLAKTDLRGNTYVCEANWKVLLDNYLECHHCGTAHDTFNDIMDIANSKFTLHKNFVHQVAPTSMKEENRAYPLSLEFDVTVAHFWFLFPNTVFGLFPGGRSFYVSSFLPLSAGQTTRRSIYLEPAVPTDPGMEERSRIRAEWSSSVVSLEDRALCENVQKGMQQRGYQEGWYITDPDAHGISEHAMRYFHDLYLTQMEQKHPES